MRMDLHFYNVITRPSKDDEFAEALVCFIGMLEKLSEPYVAVGSISLQSYLHRFNRIPGDFDVTMPEAAIESLMVLCKEDPRLRWEEDGVASRVYFFNKIYMHVIPDQMRYIDRKTNTIFARVPIYHPDRTEIREIKLITENSNIKIRVPLLEYAFVLNLFAPLDSNAFSLAINILDQYKLDDEKINEFLTRIPVMRPILNERFYAFTLLLQKENRQYLSKLPNCIVHAKKSLNHID